MTAVAELVDETDPGSALAAAIQSSKIQGMLSSASTKTRPAAASSDKFAQALVLSATAFSNNHEKFTQLCGLLIQGGYRREEINTALKDAGGKKNLSRRGFASAKLAGKAGSVGLSMGDTNVTGLKKRWPLYICKQQYNKYESIYNIYRHIKYTLWIMRTLCT